MPHFRKRFGHDFEAEARHRKVIEAHMAGNDFGTIANTLNLSYAAVRKIVRKWKEGTATQPPHQAGPYAAPAGQHSGDWGEQSAALRMDTGQELPGVLVEEIGGYNGVMEEHVDFLKQRFTLITLKELKDNTEELAEKIKYIFNWANKPDVDSELLRCLPNLKVIASAGAGVDHLDIQMISSHGVKVLNTPDAVSSSTADLAMTLLLVSARNFMEAHQIAMSPSTDQFHINWVGGDITGKTLGIVGMGRIGYKIARRGRALEMKIVYHNRRRRQDREISVRATYCDRLDDLLQQSDFVMLAVNLNSESEMMIGKREFNLMKPSATLINISRGLVVDQEALVEVLQTGQIKAAALDVTYPEPLPRDHPLLTMSNVLLSPHMGTATHDTLRVMMENMAKDLMNVVKGRPVSNEVTDY